MHLSCHRKPATAQQNESKNSVLLWKEKFTVYKFTSVLFSNRYVCSVKACIKYGVLNFISKKESFDIAGVCVSVWTRVDYLLNRVIPYAFVIPHLESVPWLQKLFASILIVLENKQKKIIKIEPVVNIVVATNRSNFNYHN